MNLVSPLIIITAWSKPRSRGDEPNMPVYVWDTEAKTPLTRG